MKSVYCICYLEDKYYKQINLDLVEKGFTNVRAIIPTLTLTKRTSRNKPFYKEVPVLFNYGFIKMPQNLAFSRDFLNKLRKVIPGIRSWVKSPESLHAKKKKLRIDNMDIFDDFSMVAIATKTEVRYFQRLARNNKKFSEKDIKRVSVGDYVMLRGYPYEGMEATILSINSKTRKIKLLAYPETGKLELTLPLDNVLYDVYDNYEPDANIESPDYNVNNITEEAINRVLGYKQY